MTMSEDFQELEQIPPVVVGGLTLEETKQYLRVDFDDDDLIIEAFIKTAEIYYLEITYEVYRNKQKNIKYY